MKDSVTLFFFANNNHTQNVRTLQSIYTQDYKCIQLIICNDCTYGFESERLLNNFQEFKPENVQQILFHENPTPMGEYASQAQFWHRLNSTFLLTIHSGERFTGPSALTDCVRSLRNDASLAAAVTGVELWNETFETRLSTKNAGVRQVFTAETAAKFPCDSLRDCMVLYRLSALRELTLSSDRHSTHIGRFLIPKLLETGHRVVTLPMCLCKYSEASLADVSRPVPTTFGNETLRSIDTLLQAQTAGHETDGDLFRSTLPAPKHKNPNRRLVLLYKLSTLAWIRNWAIIALLLITAGALFLNLESTVTFALGIAFLICAIGALCIMAALLGCNLYFKRNPQRLVNQNGK